jgi:proline-specific peptidase
MVSLVRSSAVQLGFVYYTVAAFTRWHYVRRSFSALHAKLAVQRADGEVFQMDFDFLRRPTSLTPVVVVHGGPGLPSDYLRPLQDVITDRSILFYDQIGCGNSDVPPNPSHKYYSIDLLTADLHNLVNHVQLERFHLYGQSFGGVLAFEYLKQVGTEKQQNVFLAE